METFFHICTFADVVNAQTWEVSPQKIQSSHLNYIGTGEETVADRRVPVTIPETITRHISSPVPLQVAN